MLMLTRDATELIQQLATAPETEGVRITPAAHSSPNSSGPTFHIELAAAPSVEDTVIEAEGAHIFLAPDAASALADKVLDADLHGEAVRFAILDQ
jgi:iron-sulfur cluster assembly protein